MDNNIIATNTSYPSAKSYEEWMWKYLRPLSTGKEVGCSTVMQETLILNPDDLDKWYQEKNFLQSAPNVQQPVLPELRFMRRIVRTVSIIKVIQGKEVDEQDIKTFCDELNPMYQDGIIEGVGPGPMCGIQLMEWGDVGSVNKTNRTAVIHMAYTRIEVDVLKMLNQRYFTEGQAGFCREGELPILTNWQDRKLPRNEQECHPTQNRAVFDGDKLRKTFDDWKDEMSGTRSGGTHSVFSAKSFLEYLLNLSYDKDGKDSH